MPMPSRAREQAVGSECTGYSSAAPNRCGGNKRVELQISGSESSPDPRFNEILEPMGGFRFLGVHGCRRAGQSGVCFAIDQCHGFPGFKLEIGGEQVVYAIEFASDAVGAVSCGAGKDVVQLMRQHAAEGAAENLLAVLRANEEQFLLNEAPDGRTIHVGERQDGAIAHMGPAQGAGVGVMGYEVGNVAAAFEVDHGQFDRYLLSVGGGAANNEER